jgi:hypothetical protein
MSRRIEKPERNQRKVLDAAKDPHMISVEKSSMDARISMPKKGTT